jgi:hypothetical protein
MLVFVVHRYIIVRHQNKRAMLEEEAERRRVTADVEMQVRRFVEVPTVVEQRAPEMDRERMLRKPLPTFRA